MANRVSPFAALTGAEKQIKWLEYQSVRLPYIQSGPEEAAAPSAAQPPKREKEPPANREAAKPAMPAPPPEVLRAQTPPRGDFQRSRHSQYDAVIARLKQAELQAGSYRPMS